MPETTKKKQNRAYDSDSYASRFLPDKSIYQDDRRIFHRGDCKYDTVAEIGQIAFKNGILEAAAVMASGKKARLLLQTVRNGILRLGLAPASRQGRIFENSEMLAPLPRKKTGWRFREKSGACELRSKNHRLILAKKPFSLKIVNAKGARVLELETERIAGKPVCPPLGFRHSETGTEPFISWRIGNEDRFFGLGEKWNKVEKTSTRATIWAGDTCGSNTNDMSYKSVPALFSTAGWGLMLHTSFRSFWEIGAFSYTAGAALSQDDHLDAFLFLGDSLKKLNRLYTSLTGRPHMPPKWALGIWMSRCMYENLRQAEDVIDRLRAEKIPFDVIHLDPKWMKTHYYYDIGVDACDFVWNEKGFPKRGEFLQRFKAKGVNTCFWVNPYLPEGQPIYEEAKRKGFILRSTKGGFARLEHGQPAGMVDFSNPEAKEWWKNHLKDLLRAGGSVLKPDYGDRVAEDALFHNGKTGREMHNLYLYLFTKTAFEAAREVNGENIVWRRAGYIGSQRYPGTWAGDTQVSWEAFRCCLRGGLSAGFTGEAFWSMDIGGFTGPKPSEELYLRWAQCGLLVPFARFHGTTPREPWHYSERAVRVVRRYARIRYSLVPYLMACARESGKTGLPIMRHMKLEFEDEPNVETLDDQYMLGPDLLVAPVLKQGARERWVYFPKGEWRSFDNPLSVVSGPGFHKVKASLERMPVFARPGAVLPRYAQAPHHLKGAPPENLNIEIYPGEAHKRLVIYENGFAVKINYDYTGSSGTFSVNAAPLSLTVKSAGWKAKSVSGHPKPIRKRQTKTGTEITFGAASGAQIRFS